MAIVGCYGDDIRASPLVIKRSGAQARLDDSARRFVGPQDRSSALVIVQCRRQMSVYLFLDTGRVTWR